MEFTANEGKQVEIAANGGRYLRHAIRTHFVTVGENYLDLIRKYVSPLYQPGDLLSVSEKVIALCQGRVVYRKDIKIGLWAKFLSRFACGKSSAGPGVSLPVKMQYAINKVGLPRILAAAIAGGLGKLVGIKGIFYRIAGREVSGLDGFYGGEWEAYRDVGIEIPHDPTGVCREIKHKLGISCMIVDANDLGQEILGRSSDLTLSDEALRQLIRDNPAGQGKECTPFILIRRKSE